MKMTAPPMAYAEQRVASNDATDARKPARLSLFEEAWMQLSCRRQRGAANEVIPHSARSTPSEGQSHA